MTPSPGWAVKSSPILIETSDEPAGELAQRVVSALEAPVPLSGLPVSVTVSVGVATALAGADDGMSAGELLRRADAAMYAAKGSGKATWTGYDPFAHGTTARRTGMQIRPPAH